MQTELFNITAASPDIWEGLEKTDIEHYLDGLWSAWCDPGEDIPQTYLSDPNHKWRAVSAHTWVAAE